MTVVERRDTAPRPSHALPSLKGSALALPAIACGLVMAGAAPALAHDGHGPHGVAGGFSHVVLGPDHLLAMLAVGMLAARRGAGELLVLPLVFMALMGVGLCAAWALAAGTMEGVAALPAIAAFMLGAAVLGAGWLRGRVRAPIYALVGLCAVIHGWSHGAGAVDPQHDAAYFAGLFAASGLLHGLGVVLILSLRSIIVVDGPRGEAQAG